MQPTGINLSARHFIPTLIERKAEGISAFAYCPICDKVEKSNDDERGELRATDTAIAKIRMHMRLRHRTDTSK